MIEIVGRILNAVDCGCYDIAAVPAQDPRESAHECGCEEGAFRKAPPDATKLVRIDAEHAFRISVDDDQLRRWFADKTPWFRFRVYLNSELKLTTRAPYRWIGGKRSELVEIDLCAPAELAACAKVCGRITNCRGKPLAGLRVRVYDVDLYDAISLGKEGAPVNSMVAREPRKLGTLLGETLTNACGEYCLCYTRESYADAEIGMADLRLIVGPGNGRFQALQVSEIHFNAASNITVDLTVPGSQLDGGGEFIEYHDALTRLGCATPGQRAALTDAQLSFICSEAAIPIDHLSLLRQAYEIDAAFIEPLEHLPPHIAPQLIYGLLRTGFTGAFPDWARAYGRFEPSGVRPGAGFAEHLVQAIDRCVIDRGLGFTGRADTDAAGELFWMFSFIQALTAPLLPGRSSWRDLFAVAFPLPAGFPLLLAFGLAWFRFGLGDSLWPAVQPPFNAAQLKTLRKLLEYADVSGYYAPAVALFFNDEAGLLAAVASDAAWNVYFTAAAVNPAPGGIAFSVYSAQVRERARVLLGASSVGGWVGGASAADFPTLNLSASEAQQSAERLGRLTTSSAFAAKLAAAGFTSARDIAELSWSEFRMRVNEPEGSVLALFTFTKARETRAVATAATLQLAPVLNAPFENVAIPFLVRPQFSGTSLDGIADSVFGSGSECDCEGRQSVFSAPAYLHALRRFLAGVGALGGGGPTGRAVLDARRLEMQSLQLSYVNSNTPMPTIDLNNEVLEDLVAPTLNPPVARIPNRQTTLEAAELELQYEYENAGVYAGFVGDSSLIRPWRFPFHLNHSKRNILLQALGASREQIIQLSSIAPTAQALSEAVLDLNEGQRLQLESALLPLSDTFNATRTQLKNPLTMMDRAQLGFQDLYAITQLVAVYSDMTPPAINPPVDGSGATPCDPSSYQLNDAPGSTTALTQGQADRIHRVVRLWRALPWPLYVLDWAIGAFVVRGQKLLPLEWLGMAELVRRRLKLKAQEIVGFWGTLSTRRWEMPFVKTKAIPSPWEQVFRVPIVDLTVAAAARSAGISQQFAATLQGTAAFDEAIASLFYRYGRLSKSLPGVQPEDLWHYASLKPVDLFASPENTWRAVQELDVIRRAGAPLASSLPLYLAQPDAGTSFARREMLIAAESVNRSAQVPSGVPFETALAHFLPDATVTLVAARLAEYATAATAEDLVSLDAALTELLALPALAAPALSGQSDTERRQRILAALSQALWDRDIASVLCQASGLDTATARLMADNINTSTGESIIAQMRALVGDGGSWTGWPTTVPAPDTQAAFLEQGVIRIGPDTIALGALNTTLTAQLIADSPGTYQLRAKVSYDAATGGSVSIDGGSVAPGETVLIGLPLKVSAIDSMTKGVTFAIAATAACTIALELVQPSGDTNALPGARLYSRPAGLAVVENALEALELIALAGMLSAQWKLNSTDLPLLVRLQQGSASFPAFPPVGASVTRRPLTVDDDDGFIVWLTYARLVAALKIARGEGRRILYETALLAQSGSANSVDIWSGIAQALVLDVSFVSDAATQLGLGIADVGNGFGWLELFDLSLALQANGVSATTFVQWSNSFGGGLATYLDSTAIVASLDAAARTKLSQSRSGGDTLRAAIDEIRTLKRDVLCDYVLARPPAGQAFQTRVDISDHLLSDVEMEACAQTSRIRFAIAGAQRLVGQTLAQAEPLRLSSDQEIEWRAIFQYQLWAARLRILLYPETYVKFGRHLQRTAEFDELERSLLQADLTDEQAIEALTRYAEQLHLIGHLEIVGTCVQQEFDATGAMSLNLLHVIGRTPAQPRAYYYRQRVDGAYWTSWQKIELDIDCDQIVPVVHNRQLHLFWLVEDTVTQKKPDITKDDRQISLEDTYKTLSLVWSVLTTKGWRTKMKSETALATRFGHYAANSFRALGLFNPYTEVHGWNQAVQDTGTYQLHPTISDEGDIIIKVYASLETTLVQKMDLGLPDFVYQIRDTMNQVGGPGDAWFSQISDAATSTLNSLTGPISASIASALNIASPTVPTLSGSGSETDTTLESHLIGTFRLTPDNLVDVRARNAASDSLPQDLAAPERDETPAIIPSAVARSGALEFDDGSVELYAGGSYRTVLGTAGTPVRVVVTRQEATPSEHDPIFCRIKNRAFFAFKMPPPIPAAATVQRPEKPLWQIVSGFQTVPREYIEHAATVGHVLAPALEVRVGHGSALASSFAATYVQQSVRSVAGPWRFALAHHPQSIELLRAIRAGLDRLYTRDTEKDARAATGSLSVPFDFDPDYDPISPWVDLGHLPEDALEFRPDQFFAVHNWELLYHAAMLVAQQSMRVGQYEAARQWIARVFNPRDPAVRDPAFGPPPHPENYWVFKPFVDFVAGGGVGDLTNLDPNGGVDAYLRSVFLALVRQWRLDPFNPHAVAAFRPQAYQLAAILLAAENLIAWGESLMAAPSAELVEEAARRFEEAERIVGRPPVSTGAIRFDVPALSVAALESGGGPADPALASVALENALSLGDGPSPQVEDTFLPDLAIGYFCLPPNPKIKELRDRIQDRLFKVHHCLDLLGNPRTLPLYDPPISPELLADAAMAGLNVSQAVMDAYTPRPHHRCLTLLTLAKALIQQVISLGAGLLANMEKRDAESLSVLRATHEAKTLERASDIRKLQVEDADAAIKVLDATLATIEHRQEYYASREFMNAEETAQIVLSIASTVFRIIGQGLSTTASALGAVPEITVGGAGFAGSPVALTTFGGGSFSRVPAGLGLAMSAAGDMLGTLSSVVGSMGSFRRRKEDWDFNAASAALEAKQVNAQKIGAQIRQAIAARELENHQAQLEESREVLELLKSKQTSLNLYEWLVDDIGASYFRSFQLAHSMALQAQRALQDELGTTDRFIGYSQWDGSRNGLQAGERLMQDVLEMEAFYRHQNARPVSKTIQVNLSQVDPIALARLKATGGCDFELTEAFWDRHAPQLYFRRFLSVSASVPAVVSPFSGVHGRLSLIRGSYRADPSLPGTDASSTDDDLAAAYVRQTDGDDPRFVDIFARPGDFIELSTGVRDTGLSSEELREDRYRPGENVGIHSSWHLNIPQRDNAFDLATIAEVVLHVEYTGRDGGERLASAARAALAARTSQEGFFLSMRQQFAGEWQRFKLGQAVQFDIARLLPLYGVPRKGRKFEAFSVMLLLHAKEQPDEDAVTSIKLTLPQALVGTTNTETYDLAFSAEIDGASRYAFDAKTLIDDSTAASDAIYDALTSAKWGLDPVAGTDVDASDFEDLIISVNWVLGEE